MLLPEAILLRQQAVYNPIADTQMIMIADESEGMYHLTIKTKDESFSASYEASALDELHHLAQRCSEEFDDQYHPNAWQIP